MNDPMDDLLRKIADFILGYQTSKKGPPRVNLTLWNQGIATAASQVLDNQGNEKLREAIGIYFRDRLKQIWEEIQLKEVENKLDKLK